MENNNQIFGKFKKIQEIKNWKIFNKTKLNFSINIKLNINLIMVSLMLLT